MRLLTAAEQRELDRLAAAEADLPGRVLMESAGGAVARAVLEAGPVRRVVLFCGPGNNGGDGWVAARFLAEELEGGVGGVGDGGGDRVLCVSTVAIERLRGDAASAARALLGAGGRWALADALLAGPEHEAWRNLGPGDAVVDAVFGSGLSRAPAGLEAASIELINESRRRGARVVAVDVPSGIDADTGAVYPSHLAQADLTVTFHLPKRGLWLHPGAASAGRIVVAPIGLPRALEERLPSPACELLDEAWALAHLSPRPATAHKHDFGHVLAVAGSPGKAGAAALLCEGALRAGAGLVTLAARQEVLDSVLPQLPEVMSVRLSGGSAEAPLSLAELAPLRAALAGKTALAVGPGIARGAETGPLLGALLAGLDPSCAAVFDADALNALSEHRAEIGPWCAQAKVRPLFTPHAAELARLTGEERERFESDRVDAAVRAAARFSAVVVLKGAHSVVADPEGTSGICGPGNPGMAVAGAGDVLTGISAALLGRRTGSGSVGERARLAVLLHALAGDEAAAEVGEAALVATDLARIGLPRVLRRLEQRGLAAAARR